MLEFLKNTFAAKVLTLTLILTTVLALMNEVFLNGSKFVALAQDKTLIPKVAASLDSAIPTPIPQKREVWMDASDYSVANTGVAIVVYGRTPDATNHQIAEFIKARFHEKGVVSTYFTSREDNIGVSFGFYLNGDAYGPVGLTKMTATIDEVAGHAQGLQTLQTSPKR